MGDVHRAFDTFRRVDDVFSGDFTSTIIIQNIAESTGGASIEQVAQDIPTNLPGTEKIWAWKIGSVDQLLPPGPYFLVGGNIHQAWRLYPDNLDSFITTVIQDNLTDIHRYYMVVSDYCSPLTSQFILHPRYRVIGWYLESCRSS